MISLSKDLSFIVVDRGITGGLSKSFQVLLWCVCFNIFLIPKVWPFL